MTCDCACFSYERPAGASIHDSMLVYWQTGLIGQQVLLLVVKHGVGIKDLSQVSLPTVHSDLFSLVFQQFCVQMLKRKAPDQLSTSNKEKVHQYSVE